MMKKWLAPMAGAVVALIAIAGVAFAVAGSPFGSGIETQPAARPENDGEQGRSVAGACIEGVPECEDTIVIPLDRTEPPASAAPGDGWNTCDLVHNITACENDAIAAAKADLASRLGANAEEWKVVSVEFMEWPDACLGVSEPGVACAQVITPGFKIVLDNGLLAFTYNTDMGRRAVPGE